MFGNRCLELKVTEKLKAEKAFTDSIHNNKNHTMEFNRDEFNWTEEAVVGLSLLLIGGEIDSFGDKINGNIFYEVGKHKITGKTVIMPTNRNQKHEFVNDIMKRKNKFN